MLGGARCPAGIWNALYSWSPAIIGLWWDWGGSHWPCWSLGLWGTAGLTSPPPSCARLRSAQQTLVANTALSLLWSRLFVFVEEDHQEVLRDLSTPQLQPGPGYLHLILLQNLLVQPERVPRTQASSGLRWQGVPCQCTSPAQQWWEKGAPEGLKSMVRIPQEGMDIEHTAE